MKEVSVFTIEKKVRDMCIEANSVLPDDLTQCIIQAEKDEKFSLGKSIMGDLVRNLDAALEIGVPICQDTGMAVVFVELGQDVRIVDGLLEDAINNGVARGYVEGKLRCSVVADPLNRVNTDNNAPAIIHTRIVAGDELKITVAPKGFGSENMSRLKMFTPASGRKEILDFICETVKLAGSNPCPPIVVGVGIGGDFEYSALLSKKALCRPVSLRNEDLYYADMEKEALEMINNLDIGPQGFGGVTTALAVNIEKYPTHIAGLPVAVNIGCHVTRHKSTIF